MSEEIGSPVKPYRQVASIGGKAVFCAKALIVVCILLIIGEGWFLTTLDESYFTEELKPAEMFVGILALLYTVTYIAIAICFCRWTHRCYSNLPALGSPEPRYSPGWAVGSYFVPVMNMFRPFRAMKDIWNGTLGMDLQTKAPVVTRWWTGWIIMNIIGRMVVRAEQGADTLSKVQTATAISLVSSAVDILGTILMIQLVTAVIEMQTSKASSLSGSNPLYGDDLPASGR